MKEIILLIFLFLHVISPNDLLRQVSFESFFPSNPEEKLHFLDNFNSWYSEINYSAKIQVSQGKHVFF